MLVSAQITHRAKLKIIHTKIIVLVLRLNSNIQTYIFACIKILYSYSSSSYDSYSHCIAGSAARVILFHLLLSIASSSRHPSSFIRILYSYIHPYMHVCMFDIDVEDDNHSPLIN